MEIDNSADNTEALIEKAKAEASAKDAYALISQTGLELLKSFPVLGPVLAAGHELQTQRRLEYIEKSAEDLRRAAAELASRLGSVERNVNDERLTGLVFEGFARAVQAQTEGQRRRTMRAVRNAVLSAGNPETDHDDQAWMLKAADEMVGADVDVLVRAYRASTIKGSDDRYTPDDPDHAFGALARLRALGFLQPESGSAALKASASQFAPISALGKRFVEFALDDTV